MTLTREEFRQAGDTVAAWRRPLLISHTRPDGDALGCLVAMRSILRLAGATPTAITLDPVPPKYSLFCEGEPLAVWGDGVAPADLARVDGVLIMDACTYDQLESISDWLRRAQCPKVVVDHHVTRDPLADMYLIDDSVGAACEILYEWADACKWEIDAVARQALFVGMATDTGWFRFANTGARSMEIAAELIRRGVVPDVLYRRIYESDSVARVRLFGAALESMELFHDDRLALMTLSQELFTRTGATRADTEDIVNAALRVATVEVAVLITESTDGVVKLSFRSKGHVDVAELAGRFGGGGHTRAAGARVKMPLARIKCEVIETIIALGF